MVRKVAVIAGACAAPFGGLVFGQDYGVMSDVSKIRRAGFDERLDSTVMGLKMLRDYRAMNILP